MVMCERPMATLAGVLKVVVPRAMQSSVSYKMRKQETDKKMRPAYREKHHALVVLFVRCVINTYTVVNVRIFRK